jgi:ABC-type Zn uptake system ZnuABC Zn-binding protein ZnuA
LGCSPSEQNAAGAGKPRVVATTTMIADLAQELGGADVEVSSLLRPGGDPHVYAPTPSDAKLIAQADLVLTNGLHLEGWIEDLVRNAGGKAKIEIVSDGITPLTDPSRTGYPDPHIWHDPTLWREAAKNVRDDLKALDPAHAQGYDERAKAYDEELAKLDGWVKGEVAKIPQGRRVLVTSHDAFQYYGRAYGLEVIAVQGLSTETEAGAQDVARVVEVVKGRKLPAVFVETSVNPKLIEQISRESGAKVGGSLYSDSLGLPSEPSHTYKGMIEANTRQIVEALGGTP